MREIPDFKILNNSELLAKTKEVMADEIQSTLIVLHALREIERRRFFAVKSYPSLFEFCVSELGYKKGAAYRRILAMRALKENPEVEEKIKCGVLNITTVSQIQGYFDKKKREQKPLSVLEKQKIIKDLENKSTRQTDEYLLELSPGVPVAEVMRPLTSESFDFRVTLPKRVKDKLDGLKNLLAPARSTIDTVETIEHALDLAIRSEEKKRATSLRVPAPGICKSVEKNGSETTQQKANSVHLRRKVWVRDQGQCTYVNPITQKRCNSKHYLEVDHVKPRALGGSNEMANLRLLCRSHNQLSAIEQLGFEKMASHIGVEGEGIRQSTEYPEN